MPGRPTTQARLPFSRTTSVTVRSPSPSSRGMREASPVAEPSSRAGAVGRSCGAPCGVTAPRGAAPARVRASAATVHASSGETRSASVRSDAASVPFFAAVETGRFSTRFCALVSIFTSIRARAASRGNPVAASAADTMASGTAWTRSRTSRSASRVVRPSWPSRQSRPGSSSREASSAAMMPAAARSASS